MKIIADACTVILLAKASVLEACMESYPVYVPDPVSSEVLEGKKNLHYDALLFERLLADRKFAIVGSDTQLTARIMKDFAMGKGEASCISTAIIHKDLTVATDNRQGRKAARVYSLKLVGCLSLVTALYRKKKIDKEKAMRTLLILQKSGWYHSSLIEKAKEDLQ